MKCISRIIVTALFVLAPTLFSTNVSAVLMINQSENVFNFQQKLAKQGNPQAMYELAMMYESGIGVQQDINMAKQWYTQASKAGVKAASDRSIFLVVKEQGYQVASHSAWVSGVKADAKERKVDAMLLLGQMYRSGIGVKKDLNKSLSLLIYVNSTGEANMEKEIASIQDEIEAKNIAETNRKNEIDSGSGSIRKAKVVPVKTATKAITRQANTVQAEPKLLARKEQDTKAKKRREYEKVMEKLRLEQQKIDQLQSMVSGEEVASVDDEI